MLNPEPSLSQSDLTLDSRPLSDQPGHFAVIEDEKSDNALT